MSIERKTRIYIAGDCVIWNSEEAFKEMIANYQQYGYKSMEDMLIELNWREFLKKTSFTPGALEYLQSHPEAQIITDVYTYDNEALAKYRSIIDHDLHNDLIFIPHNEKSSDAVKANGAILVDNNVIVLNNWMMAGGIPILFDNRHPNEDRFGRINPGFGTVQDLRDLDVYVKKLHR